MGYCIYLLSPTLSQITPSKSKARILLLPIADSRTESPFRRSPGDNLWNGSETRFDKRILICIALNAFSHSTRPIEVWMAHTNKWCESQTTVIRGNMAIWAHSFHHHTAGSRMLIVSTYAECIRSNSTWQVVIYVHEKWLKSHVWIKVRITVSKGGQKCKTTGSSPFSWSVHKQCCICIVIYIT